MKRLDFRSVVVVLLAAAAGCKGDPTAELRTGVSDLGLNPDLMFIDRGSTKAFHVLVRDQQLNPVAAPVTVTSTNPAVMTVAVDSSVPTGDSAHYDYLVTAVEVGTGKLVATSGGVSDTADVTVLPIVFPGAVSSTTPKGGDTLKISATTLLKFDPTQVVVHFGDASPATILKKTPDSLRIIVPFGSAVATIDGIVVTYVPGLVVTLPIGPAVHQTGDFWAPGDTGYATAPTMPLPTATGQSFQYITQLPGVLNDANCGEGTASGGTGKCTIFKYVANGTDSLTFTVDWTPPTDAADNSDIDVYSCNSTGVAGCFEAGSGAGATGKTPESFTIKPSAGTHYFVIEQYSGGEDPNMYVTITKRN